MTGFKLARGFPASIAYGPLLMLFLCFCGMAIGLAIDCGTVPLSVVASLCIAGSSTLASSVRVHVAMLPATHVLMITGAVLAAALINDAADRPRGSRSWREIATRYAPNSACAVAMLAGMVVVGWLGPPVPRSLGIGSVTAQLMVAMVLGMVASTVVAMPFYNCSPPRQRGMSQSAPDRRGKGQ